MRAEKQVDEAIVIGAVEICKLAWKWWNFEGTAILIDFDPLVYNFFSFLDTFTHLRSAY